jgi:type IV secretory pathway VirJ component
MWPNPFKTDQPMKIKRSIRICFLIVGLTVIALWLASPIKPPIIQQVINTEKFSDITVTQPMWGSKGLAMVFVDSNKYPAEELAKRLAATGVTTAIINSLDMLAKFDPDNKKCLDHDYIADSVRALKKELTFSYGNRLIIAGIGDGALLPFVNAQTNSGSNVTNLSIGFSVNLPTDVALCPPLSIQVHDQNVRLVTSSELKGLWRSVWTDQPADETAIFIRTLGKVDTRIAPYDTPLDALLAEELKYIIGQTSQDAPPMPVVEVPVAKSSDNVTLFYSGDGGWRDLDRTVAGEMAALNYPVVGVDVLRYFWEHKSPEQAAADLSSTMAYYRKHWNTRNFVLAGYSFGADIMPALYNRLPGQDKDSVALLVLIALGKTADFEIHVSGWLGQSAGEQPLAADLAQIPPAKILCVYGLEEKAESACTGLQNSEAKILELPGGHHFDQDYPKLTKQILAVYQQHGLN